ncbi:MAG: Gfo/Idh/MocA family oxidoreductase [Alphaproteobacteria bacterium]
MNRRVLIVGAGSVGKRHANNLKALGMEVAAVDPREDRRDEFPADIAYPTLDAALTQRFDAVAVCSPTAFHVDQALAALDSGAAVLLEKPVAMTLADAERLADRAAETGAPPVLLGYTWRWWPPLQRLRELIKAEAVGPIRFAQFVMSAHLADWHPYEPLADFFMSSARLGGGALLDESHWIDLSAWLFGMPKDLMADVDKISSLDITADDNVDMILRYDGGLRVQIHLDLHGRPHQKTIRCLGETGSLLWSEHPNRVAIARGAEEHWEDEVFSCGRNDMFMAVAQEFLHVLDGETHMTCTLADGLNAMRLIEAVRRSTADGRRIEIGP